MEAVWGTAMDRLRQSGLTLPELLIVLAIAALLLQLVMPSYAQLLIDTRLQNEARRLHLTLNLARVEAVTRNAMVVVCPRDPAREDRCGWDFAQGWIVFADLNGDGEPDHLGPFGPAIIREFPPPVADVSTRSNRVRVRYRPDGSTPDNQTLTVCPRDTTLAAAWQLTLNAAGRVRLSRQPEVCRED